MADAPTGIPPNIGNIAGPILLGFMFDWAFFAILSLQVYEYYSMFPDDQLLSKGIVYFIYCVDFVQTMLLTTDAWRMFATGYGNPAELLKVGFIWLSVPATTGIVSMVVQIFFAYRLYLLSKSRFLAGFITTVSLTQGISGIFAGVQAYRVDNLSLIPSLVFKPTLIWLAGSAVCDVIISVFMIYYLSSRDTGFKETRAIVRRLILLTIETGTVTALMAMITIIVYGVLTTETYYTCPGVIMAKLYSISAVVIFNNRAHFRKGAPPASNELATSLAWAKNPRFKNASTSNGDVATLEHSLQDGAHIQQEQWSETGDVAVELNKMGTALQDDHHTRDVKLQV